MRLVIAPLLPAKTAPLVAQVCPRRSTLPLCLLQTLLAPLRTLPGPHLIPCVTPSPLDLAPQERADLRLILDIGGRMEVAQFQNALVQAASLLKIAQDHHAFRKTFQQRDKTGRSVLAVWPRCAAICLMRRFRIF